jgi:hypothetical protein
VPGTPGQGVPVGGTAGQFLTKIDGTNYNTDWTTVNLSAYAVKANNLSDLTNFATARDNLNLGTLNNPTFAGLTLQGSGANVGQYTPTSLSLSHTTFGSFVISPSSGITFPDSSVQTTAFPAGSDLPTGGMTGQVLTKSSNANYDADWATLSLAGYATEAWVTAGFYPLTGNPSGFLTSAPVTSVAGRTGAITLSNSDISGLGSLAVVNDAPSDGSQYARKNAAWDVVIPGDRYLTTSTTSNTISNGNKTFTIGTGLSYTPTQNITISYNASNHMHGEVLTYNSGTGVLTVDINHHTGSGTYAAWVVNVGGVTPATSVAWGAITGTLSSQTDLQNALDLKLAATTAASTYQTLAGMSSYLTTSAAASTYQTQAGMSSYLTTSAAASTYQTQAGMSSYLTTSTAASTYALKTDGALKGNFTLDGTASSPNSDGSILIGSLSSGYNYLSLQAGVIQGVTYASGNKSFTLNGLEGLKLFSSGQGVRFPDATTQTTAYPGSSDFLLKADNLSGLANTGTARTNLGLGTMAVETASNYLTTATASSTYFTIASAANKADLASPTFTGTPTLPTGTIATTQSPGNNTTALATTAFVTAAVPAFSTSTQSRQGTGTTTAQNPLGDLWQMMNPGFIPILRNTLSYAATGTMGSASIGNYTSRMTMGTAGAASGSFRTFGTSQIDQAWICVSKGYRSYIDFSRVTWCSGRFYTDDTWTDPQVSAGFYFGKANNSANGNLARKGFGWRINGNATAGSRTALLQVHNGTTLTDVATSFALVAQQYFDWDVVSLGNGTVTLYINGTQVATTTAGPTGDTSYSGTTPVIWNEEFVSTGTTSAYNATFSRGLLYIAP